MNLQTLLHPTAKADFVRDYFHRQPFARAAAARFLVELGTWDLLGQILPQEDVDVMVVRDGSRYAGRDPRSAEDARRLSEDGCTLLVRHAERHHGQLAALAAAFAEDFRGAVNIHIYATPPGRHGFSWHYDAEDVFILQTAGAKEYSLRKNTVQPWPLEETLPADMRYGAEIMPLLRVLLRGGDWLYIPCGWWHKAEALPGDEAAFSLALGVMSPSAMDVYDFLRPRLLESLVWRQRLPVAGAAALDSPEDQTAYYRQLFDQLAKDLAHTLHDEKLIAEFLETQQAAPGKATAQDDGPAS